MKFLLTILFLAFYQLSSGQYSIHRIYNNGSNYIDTVLIKDDSLFRLIDGQYSFAGVVKTKAFVNSDYVNGLAALLSLKQNTLSLTTNGTSGAATLVGGTLNIPNYSTGGNAPTFINLAANFSSTSITPATVTGWSFSVTSGKTYRITVIADYQTAATTTGGIIGISLSGGATGSVRGYADGAISQSAVATELKIPIRATSGAGSTLTTTGVSVINSPHYIGLDITFTCTVSGTFNIVWGTEVAASAAQLNANSSLVYQALN